MVTWTSRTEDGQCGLYKLKWSQCCNLSHSRSFCFFARRRGKRVFHKFARQGCNFAGLASTPTISDCVNGGSFCREMEMEMEMERTTDRPTEDRRDFFRGLKFLISSPTCWRSVALEEVWGIGKGSKSDATRWQVKNNLHFVMVGLLSAGLSSAGCCLSFLINLCIIKSYHSLFYLICLTINIMVCTAGLLLLKFWSQMRWGF